MMATVVNSLILRGALTARPAVQRAAEIRADVILAAKQGVNGVYTADPKEHPGAQRFRTIRYDDVLARGLDVMDQAAFILARDRGLPIHVLDAEEHGVLDAIFTRWLWHKPSDPVRPKRRDGRSSGQHPRRR
jgi:uridylate kinase